MKFKTGDKIVIGKSRHLAAVVEGISKTAFSSKSDDTIYSIRFNDGIRADALELSMNFYIEPNDLLKEIL